MVVKMIGNKSKYGQVTIFIILALVIVVAIALVWVLIKPPQVGVSNIENPNSYIEKCVKDSTNDVVDILLKQGGDIEPRNSEFYMGENISYLCYTSEYYVACNNQKPMLIAHLKNEIKSYIEPIVENCFMNLKEELEEKRYEVEIGVMNLDVELVPKGVNVNVDRNLKMKKNDEAREFDGFKVQIMNPIYDLAVVAKDIGNEESIRCNFEYVGYSLLYPQFIIEKDQVGGAGSAADIYIIEDKASSKKMFIAIKSCVMPGGI